MRKAFPRYARLIVKNENAFTPNEIQAVLSENRQFETKQLIVKHDFEVAMKSRYNTVVECVKSGDFAQFCLNMPSTMVERDVKNMFNQIRQNLNMQILECFIPKADIKKSMSDIRERFFSKKLFNVGDKVKLINTNESGKILSRGTNYVMVETTNKTRKKCWLTTIKEYNDI